MTVYHRKSGKATSIIARETAPAAATIDMFHGKFVKKGQLKSAHEDALTK